MYTLIIANKNYSSWSLRGWLLCKIAGLDVEERRVPIDDADARAELLLLSPSFRTPAHVRAVVQAALDADADAGKYTLGDGLPELRAAAAREHFAATGVAVDADGTPSKVEISTKRDGKINRVEYYESGVLTRAEEDVDSDGKTDKWETYDRERLTSVAFDESHTGQPTRRLLYGPDGGVTVEVDPSGSAQWRVARTDSSR